MRSRYSFVRGRDNACCSASSPHVVCHPINQMQFSILTASLVKQQRNTPKMRSNKHRTCTHDMRNCHERKHSHIQLKSRADVVDRTSDVPRAALACQSIIHFGLSTPPSARPHLPTETRSSLPYNHAQRARRDKELSVRACVCWHACVNTCTSESGQMCPSPCNGMHGAFSYGFITLKGLTSGVPTSGTRRSVALTHRAQAQFNPSCSRDAGACGH